MKNIMIFIMLIVPVSLFAQLNTLKFTEQSKNVYVAKVTSGVSSMEEAYKLFLKYADEKVKNDNNLLPFGRIQLKKGKYDVWLFNDSVYALSSNQNPIKITGKVVNNADLDSDKADKCYNENKCDSITELTITKTGNEYKYTLQYLK